MAKNFGFLRFFFFFPKEDDCLRSTCGLRLPSCPRYFMAVGSVDRMAAVKNFEDRTFLSACEKGGARSCHSHQRRSLPSLFLCSRTPFPGTSPPEANLHQLSSAYPSCFISSLRSRGHGMSPVAGNQQVSTTVIKRYVDCPVSGRKGPEGEKSILDKVNKV